MHQLLFIDRFLFKLVNSSWASAWLDPLMVFVTFLGEIPWVWGLLWIGLMIKGGRKERTLGWLLVPLLLLTELSSSYFLKPFFARPRPFTTLEDVRLIVDVSHHLSQFSFPSTHATNIMAIAVLFVLAYPNRILLSIMSTLSLIVCYSRIYVGVHYPSDVVAGALLGGFLAFLFFVLAKKKKVL